MRHIFLLISIVICSLSYCKAQCHTFHGFADTERSEYNVFIQTKKAYISGVCIMKSKNDTIIGSIINEFGVKAFDFIYSNKTQKVDLKNVMGFINKWYIRKVVKSDLKYLLSQDYQNIKPIKNKELSISPEGAIKLINKKHGISYNFTTVTKDDQSDEAIK